MQKPEQPGEERLDDPADAEYPTLLALFEPFLQFIRSGAAGGLVLMVASAIALACANSPLHHAYEQLLETQLSITVNGSGLNWSLHEWVNDGLMSLFFLLVGLEIRREMAYGQLASLSRLAGPGIAAVGGMVLPALIFVGFVHGQPDVLRGWAVPMATDIAFSLAVLRVLGARVPVSLKVFLTALAIIDDLGSILVIAVFYTAQLNLVMLAAALLLCLTLWGLGRLGLRALPPYILGGVLLWWLVMRSGVHATLAGVALACVVPMARDPDTQVCPAELLERLLGSWVAYFIMPLFGFANAGLSLQGLPPGALGDPMVLGIGLGLFLGKQIGVFGATWVAVRAGIARLPGKMTMGQLYAVSILCGIGFTMSLFIGDLAFRGHVRADEVRLAVLGGSVISALVGLAVLAVVTRRRVAPAGIQARPTG
jgi:NhaA family Na+:H+ antiporter